MLLCHCWSAAAGHTRLQQGDTEQSSSIHSPNKYSSGAVGTLGAQRASLPTECLLRAWHCAKHCTGILSFNLYNDLQSKVGVCFVVFHQLAPNAINTEYLLYVSPQRQI